MRSMSLLVRHIQRTADSLIPKGYLRIWGPSDLQIDLDVLEKEAPAECLWGARECGTHLITPTGACAAASMLAPSKTWGGSDSPALQWYHVRKGSIEPVSVRRADSIAAEWRKASNPAT